MNTITTKKHNLSTWSTVNLLQKQSIDFKTSFNIFTRFKSTTSIHLNTVCAQHHMHITTSTESFEAIITFSLAACKHKSKTQRKNTSLKWRINICRWRLFKKFFRCYKSTFLFKSFTLNFCFNIDINLIDAHNV